MGPLELLTWCNAEVWRTPNGRTDRREGGNSYLDLAKFTILWQTGGHRNRWTHRLVCWNSDLDLLEPIWCLWIVFNEWLESYPLCGYILGLGAPGTNAVGASGAINGMKRWSVTGRTSARWTDRREGGNSGLDLCPHYQLCLYNLLTVSKTSIR